MPTIKTPRKALNKAYLKVKPQRTEIDKFKSNLVTLLEQVNHSESEEFNKIVLADFLKNTYYSPHHFINTSERIDLAIHNGKASHDTVGVIIEAKRFANASEMLRQDNLNAKAMQELLLYYLRERIGNNNLEIKHLMATNFDEWFIFDAHVFEKHFVHNKKLLKQFNDFEAGRLGGKTTDFFYKEVAQPAIEAVKELFDFTHFKTSDFETALKNSDKGDDVKLIPFYKLLSPQHLLKAPFANDSNSLNKAFYTELLHIIGLEEVKEGSKKLIKRKSLEKRSSGSLIENAITQVESLDRLSNIPSRSQYGDTKEDQLFNVAIDLAITWVNRILFLKLLEAQLLSYHKNDSSYSFLNSECIKDYDELNALFFQVLAVRVGDRNIDIREKFSKIPYLNSSLFEPAAIERDALFINMLSDGKKLPLLTSTVLKDGAGKKLTGELSALTYLFSFLDAYDFGNDSNEEIQEDSKALISASVLGLIFEKINGYKDGSFFTPGFITMHMSKEAVRRALVQKFNDAKGWHCESIDDVYNNITDIKEADSIINTLKICDPAVGSGHFLVSSLNEIVAIKAELRLLQDREGKRLKEYTVEVANDELIVSDEDGEIVEYNPKNAESQRIQESLFNEKQTIIENCLFGVDINPNSVKICRLRLWIELLKNAYYKADGELETLPNIDINIKCGNSLVSRFSVDADLKHALKKSKLTIAQYRSAVQTYRNAKSKDEKRDMQKLIDDVKNNFTAEILPQDKKSKKLEQLRAEIKILELPQTMFEETTKEKASRNKRREKLKQDFTNLSAEIAEIKNNKIYLNAFEWRFEFPEVLSDDGSYLGFDVVIGNPPYISAIALKKAVSDQEYKYYKSNYTIAKGTVDIYIYFFELASRIARSNSHLCYITPNRYLSANYGVALRDYLISNYTFVSISDYSSVDVFAEAQTYPVVSLFKKSTGGGDYGFYSVTYKEKQDKYTYRKFSSNQLRFLNDNILGLC